MCVMLRDAPFLENHIYHIYNRGAHKADIFLDHLDYARFQLLLFIANTSDRVHVANLIKKHKNRDKGLTFISIFKNEVTESPLVDILSYTLMPNHFHIVLRQRIEGGVTEYMRKISTAYTMHFNTRHLHSGALFQGRFKSKHVGGGDYLRWLFAYVALNPLDVRFPGWKENGVTNQAEALSFLKTYQFSSFPDMVAKQNPRPESAILSSFAIAEMGEDVPDFANIEELFRIEATSLELI